jgi:hypothetical protein
MSPGYTQVSMYTGINAKAENENTQSQTVDVYKLISFTLLKQKGLGGRKFTSFRFFA